MSAETVRPGREKVVNPAGFLATQDLKERGWTPALIARFLGEHDQTRPNGLRMGRRRLPPVKLYEEARVLEVERQDTFLAAQARAADAREKAERARETRARSREAALLAAAASYTPSIHPEPLRKGAVRKAREPYLAQLEAVAGHLGQQLAQEVGRLGAKDLELLEGLLRERLDLALSSVYPWYPAPGQTATATAPRGSEARPSDWREWDWD
ncbi:hypothetical protein [Deinococcus koreensis]|uniref:Uncharacterized protein n=1 Tax=Deinococcus koreensis TaxID=2054903 RepID=A0A2K3V192_9DEIO|nr:hypothetical protein [Deinococcus koreensis]PNY82547.1 hypothetical protein CVO96_15375 [Deinococcus koreensis]